MTLFSLISKHDVSPGKCHSHNAACKCLFMGIFLLIFTSVCLKETWAFNDINRPPKKALRASDTGEDLRGGWAVLQHTGLIQYLMLQYTVLQAIQNAEMTILMI